MKIFDGDDELRCAFAAFAMQGLMSAVDMEELEFEEARKFIAETAFDMADMMMGVRNATIRH